VTLWFFQLDGREVAALAACSTTDIENWIKRLTLTTDFPDVGRGNRRIFSEENTLEIAYISALTKSAVSPRAAVPIAAKWLSLSPSPSYWVIADGDYASPLEYDSVFDVICHIEGLNASPNICVSIVNVQEIIDRVSAVYLEQYYRHVGKVPRALDEG
jgi:hypothetical protein